MKIIHYAAGALYPQINSEHSKSSLSNGIDPGDTKQTLANNRLNL
jgi:hypothetical protein